MSTGSREYENGSTHGSGYQDPRPLRHNFPQDSSHHDTRHDSPSAGQHFPWYSNRNTNVDHPQRNYDAPPRNPLQYTNIPTPENGTTTLGITKSHPPDDDRRDYNRPDAFTRSYYRGHPQANFHHSAGPYQAQMAGTPHYVTPQVWMKAIGCPKSLKKQDRKNYLKALAKDKYPKLAKRMTLATADAMLIADYAKNIFDNTK